jgi:CHAT domain-containing protein
VDDQETSNLTRDFFVHLAGHADRAEALRKAQVNSIQRLEKRWGFAHPFYWAPLTVTGP